MRSVPAGSFQRLSTPAALWAAWTRTRKDRRRRADIAFFDLNAEERILELSEQLRTGTFRVGLPRIHAVYDPKPRAIVVTPVEDRIVQQALIAEIGPHYARSFSEQGMGCLPQRGPHQALAKVVHDARRYSWAIKLDVRAFFPNIDRNILTSLWARRLHDDDTLRLICQTQDLAEHVYARPGVRKLLRLQGEHCTGRGIVVGSYLSHFGASLYLDGLDHTLRRTIRCPAHVRYMDDLLLFGNDKDHLLRCGGEAEEYLRVHRHLDLKPNGHQAFDTRRPFSFLGRWCSTKGHFPLPKLVRNLPNRLLRATQRGRSAIVGSLATWRGLFMEGMRD